MLFSFKRENASSPVFAFEYTLTADQKSINELLGKGEVVTEAKFNAYASAPVCKVVLKSNDVNTYFIRTDLVFGESYGIFYINANEYNRLVLAAMPAFPAVEKIKDCTVGTVNPPVVTEKKEDKKDQEVSSSNASTSQSQSSSGPGWSSSSSSSSSSSEEADANVFFFGTQPKKQKVEVEKTEDGYRMQIPNNNNSQSSSKLELIEL